MITVYRQDSMLSVLVLPIGKVACVVLPSGKAVGSIVLKLLIGKAAGYYFLSAYWQGDV